MIAFFATLLTGAWKGNATLRPWIAAAIVSLAAYHLVGSTWHVISGALAGGLVGAFQDDD